MAKKPAAKEGASQWPQDWSVGVRVSVERKGKTVLDAAVADVLTALDRTRSISAAARSLGISYRHAWLLVQEAGKHAGQPLIETAIGGKQGGGAQLSEHGRFALEVFRQIQEQARSNAAKTLPKLVAAAPHKSSIIHLAAAISLQEVVAQVLAEFALIRPTVSVRTVFGASNELADQITAGSPADVFLSASPAHIDQLAQARLVDKSSRCKLAMNGLVVVGGAALAGTLKKPADLRSKCDLPLVVADPACPLGKCSADFLQDAELFDALRPRLQFADNSRAVVAALRTGEPKLGIIFGSDVANAPGAGVLLSIPTSRVKAVYEGTAIAGSAVRDESHALLKFFQSPIAQRCFRRCGFSKWLSTRPKRV